MINERPEGVVEYHDDEPDKGPPPSDTALMLDDWSIRRGEEVLDDCEDLREILKEDKRAALATADFHAAAFEPYPELADRCKDERIHRYMKNLMATQEFQDLHNETMLDVDAAEMATMHFAKGWVVVAAQDEPEDEFEKDMQCLEAASDAVDQAGEEIQQWQDMRQVFGLGGGGAGDGTKMPTEEIRKRFKRLKDSERLRDICNRSGKYLRLAQTMQRKKMSHGLDDVVGIEIGNNLSAVLPSELALLGDEDLELHFLSKHVEGNLMIRDHKGVKTESRGPVVLIVDESGSMNGDPICDAKSMALGLYWIARHQKRWITLVGFSGGTQGNYLTIAPDEERMADLMDWLEHFYGGGTDMDVPLEELPSKWPQLNVPEGKTDIIMITDACCHVPDELRESFNSFKRVTDARLSTIVINDDPGPLETVSDRWWRVTDLGLDQEAVQESFAL